MDPHRCQRVDAPSGSPTKTVSRNRNSSRAARSAACQWTHSNDSERPWADVAANELDATGENCRGVFPDHPPTGPVQRALFAVTLQD